MFRARLLFCFGFAGVAWNYWKAEDARKKLETTLYFHSVSLAHREILADNLGEAQKLLAVSPTTPSLACDVELSSTAVAWAGIGQGSGYLMARRVTLAVAGRRVPRRRECELLLPCPNGRMRALTDGDDEQATEQATDELEDVRTA